MIPNWLSPILAVLAGLTAIGFAIDSMRCAKRVQAATDRALANAARRRRAADGVTMDSGFPIKPVAVPPSQPAMPPSSPAQTSGRHRGPTVRDPELFGRIDGVLDECDARQMPPLTEALIPNAEAWRRMGYRVEAHHPSVTVVAAHGTALPVGEDGKGQRLWVVPDGAEAVPYTPTGVLGSPGAWMFTGFEPTPSGWLARLLRRCRRP